MRMSEEGKRKWTRRAVVGAGIGGLTIAGTYGALRRWRTIGTLRHETAGPAEDQLDAHAAETVTQFLGAMFGVALTEVDEAELRGRLDYAATHDTAWRGEYEFLSAYLDAKSQASGIASYIDGSAEQRDAAMRLAVAVDTNGRTQRLRAFFRGDGRELLRMRRSTIPHLQRLYQFSGVPWRQRGYTSWPGVAANRLAYTRNLESARC
jgi:hypothetical protein